MRYSFKRRQEQTAKTRTTETTVATRSPFVPTVAQVLHAILSEVPIDVFNTMGIDETDEYASQDDPPVWHEYRQILKDHGSSRELQPIKKWDFYDAVSSDDHVLTIQTADQALWANLLLSVGVRTPE